MIQGIQSASDAIRDQHFLNLKVYDSNPKGKDSSPCIMISADTTDELAESFVREMDRRSANCQYWMVLYDRGNKGQTINPFVKDGNGVSKGILNADIPSSTAPSTGMPKDLILLSAENERLKIQLEHKTKEVEELQGQIVDLEEMLDELEEAEDDPLSASLVNMLSGFVTKNPGEAIGGGSDVMSALMKIKSVSPESEELLVKLGKLAETDPEKLKGFVITLNQNL